MRKDFRYRILLMASQFFAGLLNSQLVAKVGFCCRHKPPPLKQKPNVKNSASRLSGAIKLLLQQVEPAASRGDALPLYALRYMLSDAKGDYPSVFRDPDVHVANSSSEFVLAEYCAQTHDKLYGFVLNIYDTRGLRHHSTSDSRGEDGRKLVRHLESGGCQQVPADDRHNLGRVYLSDDGDLAG